MTDADQLRAVFVSLEVHDTWTEAVLTLADQSRLRFRHRTDERSATADGNGGAHAADQLLAKIAQFRLNAKHLEIQFADASRWEALLGWDRTAHQKGP